MKCKHCHIEIFEDERGEAFHWGRNDKGRGLLSYSYCSSAKYHGRPTRTFDTRLRATPPTKEDIVQQLLDKL